MNHAAEVRRASQESRKEAEEFIMKHSALLEGASQDQINNAIGKVAHALWELRVARLNTEKKQ